VVAVVIDATSRRRQQIKLNAIDRAGRELVNLAQAALTQRDAAERLRLLQERILHCSRDVLNYEHFVVLLLNPGTNRLEALICEGIEETRTRNELFASPENNGICGYVAATGRSYICHDVRKDTRYLSGLSNARSSLTVPLKLSDRVVGVMNIESDSVGAFSEEDRQFAEIFANHVALAMHILNLLIHERHTAQTHISGSVSAELSGPVNDIITEATGVMEEYIGHDELRKRIETIIDRACEMRTFIHGLADAPATGVLVTAADVKHKDPDFAGKRVLVADDEELMRQTIRDVLTPLGSQVDIVSDGSAAREMISRVRYDLVISDIKMPGATGYEVFAAAKDAHSDTGVILITAFGYDPHHSVIRARSEGLCAVLFKPFKVKKLLAECRAALAQHRK
jgi:CheY-like chemotaxis protein